MLKVVFSKATQHKAYLPHRFIHQRGMHSRNRKALELIAKGMNALREVDRTMDELEPKDPRLHPLFRTAKENFELALEIDNSNTRARYWLGRLHMRYQCPGACFDIGAALLVEAADMGDPEAQYELGRYLRIEKEVQTDQEAFDYLQKAADQLHPGALYLLGAIYVTGDCIKQNIAKAMWCFHKASAKGHVGAAIAYGSLLLRGHEVPESLSKLRLAKKYSEVSEDPIDLATKQFNIAAEAGSDLALQWLNKLHEEEKLRATE